MKTGAAETPVKYSFLNFVYNPSAVTPKKKTT
jgi:hypothetical protein